PEELSEIRRIWLEQKHEFDDSLPRIYEEATGEVFVDSRLTDERTILSSEEWETLKEICGDDENHLELMASLLSETSKQHLSHRRVKPFDQLEKAFARNGQSRESAIVQAQEKHELNAAVSDGVNGVEKIRQLIGKPEPSSAGKQLSWADVKFAQHDNQ
ncbi:MAG: DNA phosphorothioation system sulfurtransferase DndC, partial [Xenococcaceae cyanobacterium]